MNQAPQPPAAPVDENKLIAERREKLRGLRAAGVAYPNDFRPDACAGDLQQETSGLDADTLAAQARRVKVAGRMLGKRVMGKASFAR
ncbi:MAG: lysine--tRNA ligase, partial [Rhodanobacteraceae bacterium]